MTGTAPWVAGCPRASSLPRTGAGRGPVAAFGWFRDAVQWPGYRFTVENTVQSGGPVGPGRRSPLMEALIERRVADGKHVMVAAVDGSNEASIRFHSRLGFTEVGRMPEIGAKFGRWCDLVLVQNVSIPLSSLLLKLSPRVPTVDGDSRPAPG